MYVKLNVGGKVFCTSRQTLQSVQGSFLARLTDPTSPFRKGYRVHRSFANDDDDNESGLEDREYFIDRDGELFSYILNYLRDGKILFCWPSRNLLPQLRREAEFYGLGDLVDLVERQLHVRTDFLFIETARSQDVSLYATVSVLNNLHCLTEFEVRIVATDEYFVRWDLSVRPYVKETLKLMRVISALSRDGWKLVTSGLIHSNEASDVPVTRYVFTRDITKNANDYENFDAEEEKT